LVPAAGELDRHAVKRIVERVGVQQRVQLGHALRVDLGHALHDVELLVRCQHAGEAQLQQRLVAQLEDGGVGIGQPPVHRRAPGLCQLVAMAHSAATGVVADGHETGLGEPAQLGIDASDAGAPVQAGGALDLCLDGVAGRMPLGDHRQHDAGGLVERLGGEVRAHGAQYARFGRT